MPAQDVVGSVAFRSALTQPLISNEKLTGAVSYLSRSPGYFDERDRDRIRPLGDLWALAIQSAHLHDTAIRNARDGQEARERLQTFLGLVAHDLRGPLTTILGYAQLLLRRDTARVPESELSSLRAIEGAAVRMRRLVEDLLDASLIGAGHFQVKPEPMDLAVLVRRTVEQMQTKTPNHRLILNAPGHLEGVWDPMRLGQVLENLLANAIKYSTSGTEIVIRVDQQGKEASIGVTDHGVGLSPEQIQQLFKPFSRPTHAQRVVGIGLGLYITKCIVEAMHGRIWVESERERGSTFHVELPIA